MELKLYSKDKIRLITGSSNNNFIDCVSEHQEAALTVSFLPSQTYMEIRKKANQVKIFYFENKKHKKEFDFGYWEDAEVIFALNEVVHK
jgi:hypothetical protein